jgi:hypothetical protein
VIAGFDAKRVRPDQCQSAGFLDHFDDVLEPFVGLALADEIAYPPDDLPSPQHLSGRVFHISASRVDPPLVAIRKKAAGRVNKVRGSTQGLVHFMRKSAGHLPHLAVGKPRSKLLQAHLRLRVRSDFGSQFLIGFFCLRGTLRNSQLESVVEAPQLRFVFFLVTDVQCNTEKVRRRFVFEIGLAAGRNPALDAVTDP